MGVSADVAWWVGFHLFVVAMFVVDLGFAQSSVRPRSTRRALSWTAVWVVLSLALGVLVFAFKGRTRGEEFLTGYVLEYALSVDNLFVFLLIFSSLRVPAALQGRLLAWGILGEFAMRAPLLILGASMVRHFHGVLYAFGAFLVFSGLKTAFAKSDDALEPQKGWIWRAATRVLPLSRQPADSRFVVREEGRLRFTSLFVALVVINVTDLVFALDSIPAVLGVTQDPFVAYSSNVCAIFGLRSLFSVVASVMERFRYLKAAVSVILVFVGAKTLASYWVDVPVGASLAFIAVALGVAMLASVAAPKKS